MKTNYILVDFENVQPQTLTQLSDHPFRVMLFLGAHQSKVPLELARMLQPLGADVEYLTISGRGPNALDFHIAFYIGELAVKDPEGYFHIISKDKGFDPLIEHLRARKIRVTRSVDISEIPMLWIMAPGLQERVAAVVENLKGRGASRPRKEQTLFNTIKSLLPRESPDSEVTSILHELVRQKKVTIEDDKVTYQIKA